MSVGAVKKLSESNDTRKTIWEIVGGAVEKINVLHGKVLVAIYVSPEKSKGGIILTQRNKQEDIWQNQVGLVLKLGPIAFVDDDNNKFGGASVEVDEWVAFSPGDGKRIQINGLDCRVIEDTQLMFVVSDPSIITAYKG